jgi:hypothetical protein
MEFKIQEIRFGNRRKRFSRNSTFVLGSLQLKLNQGLLKLFQRRDKGIPRNDAALQNHWLEL